MRSREEIVFGRFSNSGKLMISHPEQIETFGKKWPNERAIITIQIVEKETSRLLVQYYLHSIVPEFRQAFKDVDGERMTLEQTDLKLRGMSSIMYAEIPNEEAGGFDLVRLMTINEVGNHRATEYLEDLKVIGATKYGIAIKDPKA